jgi:DNA-binding NarL/FixJ family response regulator
VAQKRIIVMESEPLLSAGVYSLLSTNGHLKVMSVDLDKQSFVSVANEFRPDVVIMDERVLMENFAGYMGFLKSFPRIRTIVLSIQANCLQVCDQQIVHVRNLDDFMSQI